MIKRFAACLALLLLAGNGHGAGLRVAIEQLRNDRGLLHLCLTRDARHFPDCSGDPFAVKRSVPASSATVRFEGLEPGSYALAVLHDENRNGRLDSFLGIPREGFGFSGDAGARLGPPPFGAAAIDVASGGAVHTVRMRYLL